MIDGIDIRDLQLKSLRNQIALVLQDSILFSGTIRDNLCYAKRNATDIELTEAARAADAVGFIEQLPQGFDTVIGERGLTLSGGQRQRLALARAFLRDAPILILDEATSALDSESENAIRRALQRLMRNRTTLVIAHRLSTIQSADQIVVFDNGRIVQQGRHEELMLDSDGLYRRLHDEQYDALCAHKAVAVGFHCGI
jgi:subfamily B ATP-binding cassette protein MsbA